MILTHRIGAFECKSFGPWLRRLCGSSFGCFYPEFGLQFINGMMFRAGDQLIINNQSFDDDVRTRIQVDVFPFCCKCNFAEMGQPQTELDFVQHFDELTFAHMMSTWIVPWRTVVYSISTNNFVSTSEYRNFSIINSTWTTWFQFSCSLIRF